MGSSKVRAFGAGDCGASSGGSSGARAGGLPVHWEGCGHLGREGSWLLTQPVE